MTPEASGAGDPLEGIDLIVLDKDGTLIDFHAMWGPWAVGLGERLAAATGTPAAVIDGALGYDRATGLIAPHAPLAAAPMARLREVVAGLLAERGLRAAAAERVLDAAWQPPDPVAMARPITPLRRLFGDLRATGRRIAIATSDDREPTRRTLEGFGAADLVDAIVCADDGLPVKPAADMIRHLCGWLGVPPSRAAMVGDSPADLAMGRAAGVGRVIGVLSGVGAQDDLAPLADLVLESVAELVAAHQG